MKLLPIVFTLLLVLCTKAIAIDLTGVWTGKCLNKTLDIEAKVEATLLHVGQEITGEHKVSKPLYGSGPIKGWIDIENKEFHASIKCDQLIVKMFMGGMTNYLKMRP